MTTAPTPRRPELAQAVGRFLHLVDIVRRAPSDRAARRYEDELNQAEDQLRWAVGWGSEPTCRQ